MPFTTLVETVFSVKAWWDSVTTTLVMTLMMTWSGPHDRIAVPTPPARNNNAEQHDYHTHNALLPLQLV